MPVKNKTIIVIVTISTVFVVFCNYTARCAAQCIVMAPVCVFMCLFVGLPY